MSSPQKRGPGGVFVTTQTPEERFWAKVDKTRGHGPRGECWIWTANKTSRGYGRFWDGSQRIGAHKYAYRLHHGRSARFLVCHSCDFPSCVRWGHLFDGTSAQNSKDMVKKGRQASGDISPSRLYPLSRPRGEAVNTSKLTISKVLELRALHKSGHSIRSLGRRFRITQSSAQAVVRRKSWAWVSEGMHG